MICIWPAVSSSICILIHLQQNEEESDIVMLQNTEKPVS